MNKKVASKLLYSDALRTDSPNATRILAEWQWGNAAFHLVLSRTSSWNKQAVLVVLEATFYYLMRATLSVDAMPQIIVRWHIIICSNLHEPAGSRRFHLKINMQHPLPPVG